MKISPTQWIWSIVAVLAFVGGLVSNDTMWLVLGTLSVIFIELVSIDIYFEKTTEALEEIAKGRKGEF